MAAVWKMLNEKKRNKCFCFSCIASQLHLQVSFVTGDGTLERQLAKLRKDLGEVFLAALADPDTVEICLNADGSLWQERLGEPLQPIGTMSASWGSPNS